MISVEYKVHPFAARFPMLSDVELEELADDIRERGQRHAIMLSFDGTTILDGRNRLAACQRLGLEPKTKRINSRMSEVDIINYIVSANLKRRHLTQGQRAMLILDANEEITRLVEDRERERRQRMALERDRTPQGKFAPADPHTKGSTSVEHVPSVREELAEKAGVSEWSIGVGMRLKEHAPELAEKVRSGELPLNTARTQMLAEHPELVRPKEDGGWHPPHGTPPPPNARAPKAREARIEWIRYMAGDRATSFQIGEKLGLDPVGVRRIAKDAGIAIPADKHALRKKQPTFNVDSAVGLLVSDLEAMETTIERIRSAATGLDPSNVEEYSRTLSALRKRVNGQLLNLVKELENGNSEEV